MHSTSGMSADRGKFWARTIGSMACFWARIGDDLRIMVRLRFAAQSYVKPLLDTGLWEGVKPRARIRLAEN
jgi:hypothetical protein